MYTQIINRQVAEHGIYVFQMLMGLKRITRRTIHFYLNYQRQSLPFSAAHDLVSIRSDNGLKI